MLRRELGASNLEVILLTNISKKLLFNDHVLARVGRGKVVVNAVDLEGEPLPEASRVTAREDVESFDLDEQRQNELMEAYAAIERGEGISAEELFERLAQLRAP